MQDNGYKKVLIHYGGGSAERSGLLGSIRSQLKQYGVPFLELGGVEPNPKIDLVREGVSLAKEENVDFILAVGGGSVIDSAKAIAVGALTDEDVWDDIIVGRSVIKKALPIGVVLTIAAAGSEMSWSAVITNGIYKRSMKSDFIRPKVAFMNPELTYTVSKYQTACGIVDIMMHTMGRYFTSTENCDLTDRIAEALLVSVKDAGAVVIKHPDNYEARATLMWASSLSHNNLTSCGKTFYFPVHKLEHDLSGLYDNISHGAGLAVLFPAWAKYIYSHDVNKFIQFAMRVMGLKLNFANTAQTALNGIDALKMYFKSLGMPSTLSELGISPSDYEKLADLTTDGGKKTVVSYVPLDKKAIIDIYKIADKHTEK